MGTTFNKARRCIEVGKKEDLWKRRTNDELKDLYEKPLIDQFIRSQRIRCLGHVTRMRDESLTKQNPNKRSFWKKE